MRHAPDRKADSRGGSLIEFALVSTFLLPLFLGVMDFGRVFYAADLVVGAARAGTGYALSSAARSTDIAGIRDAALEDGQNFPGLTASAQNFCACSVGGSAVTCGASCGGSTAQLKYAQVDTTLTFTTLVNYWVIPRNTTLRGRSVVRVQ